MHVIQLTRMIVLATILMVAHVPLPWRHCHKGMSTVQLTSHLRRYHASSSQSQLPRGWHWHFFQAEQASGNRLTSQGEASVWEATQSTKSRSCLASIGFPRQVNLTPRRAFGRPISADAAASEHQQLYLRYHVLLN